jgi:threonine/homoserine/homoserine lactone efflux protein
MVLSSGANFGLRRTMPHVLGITYGFTLQTLAVCAVFGFAWGHLSAPPAWLSWVGAAYLAYLALKLLRAGPVGSALVAKPLTLWEGMIFQAVNPKAWIMALTTAMPCARGWNHPGAVRFSTAPWLCCCCSRPGTWWQHG